MARSHAPFALYMPLYALVLYATERQVSQFATFCQTAAHRNTLKLLQHIKTLCNFARKKNN